MNLKDGLLTLVQFSKFSIVGVCNTVVHSSVFLGILAVYPVTQMSANVVAFTVAATFSCLANTFWSFKSALSYRILQRFCAVSVVGLLVTASLAAAADTFQISRYITLLVTLVMLPITNFLLLKCWTYRAP